MQRVDFSTAWLAFELAITERGLEATRFGLPGQSWQAAVSGPIFRVEIDGRLLTGQSPDLRAKSLSVDNAAGYRHAVIAFEASEPAVTVAHHVIVYADTGLIECWQVVTNIGAAPLVVSRMDTVALDVPDAAYDLLYFTSQWGEEFEPQRGPLSGPVTLETRAGRSSKGQHPWFALFREGGGILSGSVAWSGNWVVRFEPLPGDGYRISGGLHDWQFAKDLQPGETVESARVVLVLGDDLNDVARQYARVGRAHWYPTNALAGAAPVEWNHWWSYEDKDINEAAFAANVEKAAEIGVEVCTLDAGWFGPADAGTDWHHYRGDWDRVNSQRFPRGLRPLADLTHARGMKFGLWCEIEGLGKDARLAEDHPEFVARRDGERLGYVCFGNPSAREWAFATLSRLIEDYDCDWIKLDFNLDPGAGCNRTDHGHGAGDGLYAHYIGYYQTLERIRKAFPHVVLESCSSGGMRIDLGLLRQTHMTFLSDPDWPVHDLQIFWGASLMLAPSACLHWSYSDWRKTDHPRQRFNPHDPDLKPHQIDYYTRIGMLGLYGLSQKLPDLPGWIAGRLAEHHETYKTHIRRFVLNGELYRLTDQPRRDGGGDRWCAFQYSLPDAGEHLLVVFRLPGADAARTLALLDLDETRDYTVEWLGMGRTERLSGRALIAPGITFADLEIEDSRLLLLREER